MFKFNKKITNNIAISLIIALAIIFIGDNPRYIIPTSSTPVAEHIIVLDAGHGQPDRTELLAKVEFQRSK